MGVFDYLRCKMPLPAEGCEGMQFQTKDTDSQFLDHYEIREDGTLWYEDHDIENRSDPNAEGIMRLVGCMTSVNNRWVHCADFIGEVEFYGERPDGRGVGFSAYFVNGALRELHCVDDAPLPPAGATP